jgi:hypothetical protein
MLAYSRNFNKMRVLGTLILFCSCRGLLAVSLYEFKSKKSVDFTSLLKRDVKNVLLIDEKCIVCEGLLAHNSVVRDPKLIIGVVNEPSFRWLAKISMKYNISKLYDLKPLKLDLTDGTPQMYFYDKTGKALGKVYGKSNILKKI